MREASDTGKIPGVSLRLSYLIYSVGGMLTISEDEVPGGCEVGATEAGLVILRLEEGVEQEWLVTRLKASQSGTARSAQRRYRLNLKSIGRAASGPGHDAAIIIGRKRSA